MAVSRPRTYPASKFRFGVVLAGAVNGVNMTFTTPDDFRHDPPRADICVYFNGQRLLRVDDFAVSESGGPGTGYDTVTMLIAPKAGDKVWADYIAV